jgi:hypothetical protein
VKRLVCSPLKRCFPATLPKSTCLPSLGSSVAPGPHSVPGPAPTAACSPLAGPCSVSAPDPTVTPSLALEASRQRFSVQPLPPAGSSARPDRFHAATLQLSPGLCLAEVVQRLWLKPGPRSAPGCASSGAALCDVARHHLVLILLENSTAPTSPSPSRLTVAASERRSVEDFGRAERSGRLHAYGRLRPASVHARCRSISDLAVGAALWRN